VTEKREIETLLTDLEQTRALFLAAERRARTYLLSRGVVDQTSRGLATLLREAARASSST
jgi:hypothetical protein